MFYDTVKSTLVSIIAIAVMIVVTRVIVDFAVDRAFEAVERKQNKKGKRKMNETENRISDFPANLRRVREKRGLTRKELADKIGKAYWSIVRYEQGEREPGLEVVAKLASVLNVTCDELVMKKVEETESNAEI